MAAISPQPSNNVFDDDDEGWMDMPIIKDDIEASGLDEEDAKKYHYRSPVKASEAGNAAGNLLDVDGYGTEWRSKQDQNESEYTRLRVNEEDDADEVHLRTRYLFDEDKAMTPISQMQATKNLLTEAQRIAYVGVCALTTKEMVERLKAINTKEIKPAVQNMELWALKILGRLYYHMDLESEEQKMIESLSEHGIQAWDLVPPLMTTHTVANPEYDPEEARRQDEIRSEERSQSPDNPDEGGDESTDITVNEPSPPVSAKLPQQSPVKQSFQTTTRVLEETAAAPMPGVTTTLSAADENVTLDIRWTVLCDLFLLLIADSVYDARSRVLLELVALKLGLGWVDVVKFEQRVTEALEIQEGVEKMESQEIVEGRQKSSKKRRYMMLGLATLGGGLVIGLSAGLLAPVIGAGLGAAFTTIGIGGTTGFLAGAGGAVVITTGGVLTGSGIAARGMANRTQHVRTFELLPLHNNKRVNCILTVSGFMNSLQDDVRLPFSVLDPVVGDVFSVLWEPEMIRETGDALKILTTEVLTQLGQTVLQATVMTALMSALQWPIVLTKLGYLIDNPWSNALDRAKAAGGVLADVLMQRHLGVRPITLIGFSLGGRVIFYALLELAKQKAFGIVQDVFILGTTVTASKKTWIQVRSAVSGRFVNSYCRNDWVLNYLFRATSGGLSTVAGLRPITGVPGLENVDVTDKISGHMSYRTFMPLILDQLGFPVFADYFDEPVVPDFKEDRVVIRDDGTPKKKGWFSLKSSSSPAASNAKISRPPSYTSSALEKQQRGSMDTNHSDDDMPSREELEPSSSQLPDPSIAESVVLEKNVAEAPEIPLRAGFDLDAMKDIIRTLETEDGSQSDHFTSSKSSGPVPPIHSPVQRSESAPPVATQSLRPATPRPPHTMNPIIEDDRELVTHSLSESDMGMPNESIRSSGTNISASLLPISPSTSYLSHGESTWPSSSDNVFKSSPLSGSRSQRSDFAQSKAELSMGDTFPTSFRSHASSPLTMNPFAVTSMSSPASPDGTTIDTLATRPSANEKDPWKVFSDTKRSTSIPSSNPWS